MVIAAFCFALFVASRIRVKGPWISEAYKNKMTVSDFFGMTFSKKRLNPKMVKEYAAIKAKDKEHNL